MPDTKKGHGLKLFLKLVIGVLVIPLAAGISIAFYNNVVFVKELAGSLKYLAWGVFAYVVIHLLFYRPTYLYVLGHETVHAGISWIFGGKIKNFKVSEEGGSVDTTKSNAVVELGPYFVPIYAIIISIVYFIVASSYNINGSVFIFLIGFALAFHVISTVEVMKIRQPDIMRSGYIFSIVMAYILNIIVISLIFELLFPSFSEKKFLFDAWVLSKQSYVAIVRQLFF